MNSNAPALNPDASIDFLKRYFAGTVHPVELRSIPVAGQPVSQLFSRTPGEMRKFIEDHAAENLYFGVSTRAGGKAADCRELPALFADVDSLDGEAISRVECFVPTPSVVVCSGGGLHCYWFLKKILDAQDKKIRALLIGLCAAIGADPACKDISRVLRLPGTLNFKPKYGTPREVYLVKEDWN